MHDPAGREAIIERQAFRAALINREEVKEVICSRTPSQIHVFKQHYHSKFGVHLEEEIEFYTFGGHKKVRYSLCDFCSVLNTAYRDCAQHDMWSSFYM